MILIEKNGATRKWIKINRIYINTLIPYFKFRNSKGSLIFPKQCCIIL